MSESPVRFRSKRRGIVADDGLARVFRPLECGVDGNHGREDLVGREMLGELINTDFGHGGPPIDLVDQEPEKPQVWVAMGANLLDEIHRLQQPLHREGRARPNRHEHEVGGMERTDHEKAHVGGTVEQRKIVVLLGIVPQATPEQRKAVRERFEQGRFERVDMLGGLLRELALRLRSPVLALASQNRSAGNYGNGKGTAALDSLKESGDLEYAADVVLFLTEAQERLATPPARAVELPLAKNRHGDTGKLPLIFRPDLGTMREEARI